MPKEKLPVIPVCGKCGSSRIEKQADGKKREVKQLRLKGSQGFIGDKVPVAVIFCEDCGAVFSCQIIELADRKTAGGIILP